MVEAQHYPFSWLVAAENPGSDNLKSMVIPSPTVIDRVMRELFHDGTQLFLPISFPFILILFIFLGTSYDIIVNKTGNAPISDSVIKSNFFLRDSWCGTFYKENGRKLIKVIWTYANKAVRAAIEGKLSIWSLVLWKDIKGDQEGYSMKAEQFSFIILLNLHNEEFIGLAAALES